MILIHPPIVKPSEPPPGIARLVAACRAHNIACRPVDANLEGILALLQGNHLPEDRWGARAEKNKARNLDALRNREVYRSPSRYARAVQDVNKALRLAGGEEGVRLGLANYQDERLSPVRSDDLIRAALEPKRNPFYPYFRERLPALIEEEGPSLVGFSLGYLSQAVTTFAMVGFLKKEYPATRIVLGGGLVTSWLRSPHWRNPFAGLVDHLVAGPGESALLAMAGTIIDDSLHPLPEYDPFPLADYLSPGLVLPFAASTGCYWNRCAFCPERAEQNPYVKMPDRPAVLGLQELAQRLRPSMIHLVDNAVAPSLLKALAKQPPGVPWYGFVRVTADLLDPAFCRALKYSGCTMLKLGVESGDEEVLQAMNKGTDLDTTSRALKTIKEAGIATYVYLLFGTPGETESGARKTLSFTARMSPFIDFLNVAIFNLPAHSAEGRLLETDSFYEGDLSLYRDFTHPKGWSRRKVREFLEKKFKKNPAIAAIIRRDPPIFTSNHAPFFV